MGSSLLHLVAELVHDRREKTSQEFGRLEIRYPNSIEFGYEMDCLPPAPGESFFNTL